MKHLNTFNESIRDKMVAKSKDEIVTTDKKMLNYATDEEDLDVLKLLVKRGYNINFAMSACSTHGFFKGVEWCLANGANAFDNSLELASINGNKKIMKLIQKYRADDIKKTLDKKSIK